MLPRQPDLHRRQQKGLREEALSCPSDTANRRTADPRQTAYMTGSFLLGAPAFLTSFNSRTPASNFATLLASSNS